MATVPPHELLALLARIVFIVLLYLLVLMVLISLGKRLITPTPSVTRPVPESNYGLPGQGNGAASDGDVGASLLLVEASRSDGPPGRLVSVDRPIVIGRHPECDVVLRDGSISGRHARIALTREGLRVEDLGSTNGTFVNGQRIARPAHVQPGDTIQTGTATWRVDVAS